MKKQDTIKLNKASFSSRKDSRPNVTLDSIPKNKNKIGPVIALETIPTATSAAGGYANHVFLRCM